jgi:NAD(P)-dependent dehydrogenase (short-subunit alcohol dehydrogenase family)
MTTDRQKVALVTGAAKRLGRTIALAMAEQGWDIIVHYGRSADEAADTARDIAQLGRQAFTLQCDLSDAVAVAAMISQAVALCGPLRRVCCVVNSAAVFEQDGAADFSPHLLDRHMHTNLTAPILLAQGLHAVIPEGEQGVVINLLDQKLFNLNPDYLSYTLSKAALQAATTMLAQALAPTLRVAGVAPGITLVSGDQSGAGFAKAHTATPLGRSSTPQDIADAVCFVANARAITGTTLIVDGGQHLIPLPRDVMFLAQ